MSRSWGRVATGGGRGALCALVLLAAGAAGAQDKPETGLIQPNGIKIGDGRLHPYLDIEGRIDSAAVVATPAAGTGLLLGPEFIMRFRPGLRFDLTTPSTSLNFNGNGEYVWYTGVLSPISTAASRFQTDVSLAAAFNKDGAVEFQVGDQLVRSDRTGNVAVGIGVVSLFNSAYISAPIHPGGRGLEFTPKVGWTIEFFEPMLPGLPQSCTAGDPTCDPAALAQMNYNNLAFELGAKWRFLPKTALAANVSLDWRTYPWVPNTSPIATIIKGLVGLTGLLTTKLSVVAMAGGGGDANGSGAATFLATAEVGFRPLDNLALRGGYMRTIQPVALYGTFGDDRFYLDVNTHFFRRLTLGLGGSYDLLTFYGSAAGRSDHLVGANVSAGVIIFSWFNVGAAYNFGLRIAPTTGPGAATSPTIGYTRHEGSLRLTFQY